MTMVRDGDVHRVPAVVNVCRADRPGRRGPDNDDDDIDEGDCHRPLPPLPPLRRDSKTTRPRGGRGDVRPYNHVPIRTVYPSHDPPSDCPSENELSDPNNNQSENPSGDPSKDPSGGQAWERREACANESRCCPRCRGEGEGPIRHHPKYTIHGDYDSIVGGGDDDGGGRLSVVDVEVERTKKLLKASTSKFT